MEGGSNVTRSIVEELHASDSRGVQMYGGGGVTPSIIHELHSRDIQRDEIEDENGLSQSIIDELHSLDIQGDEMESEKMVLHEVSYMNLIPILGTSKEMKRKVKVVLREVSLSNFILGRS